MIFPEIGPEYVLVRYIASGGQADVFEARHKRGGGRFAVRLLREAWDDIACDEFKKSAERQIRAAGPRVVRVLACDLDASHPFMVLEYMPRGSLADEICRRTEGFTLSEALAISRSLAVALSDAHAKNLAHGDFKPGNVLRNSAGAWILSDFGCAITVGPAEVLRAQRWLGTPTYAAPERFRGEACLASDVYGLGVVLRELIAGSADAPDGVLTELVARHGTKAAGLPELIARLTALDHRQRPTAREAVALLTEAWRRAAGPTSPLHSIPTGSRAPTAGNPSVISAGGSRSGWGQVLGWATILAGAAAIANRSTKSWDPSVARYRGFDGKLRGGGLFD